MKKDKIKKELIPERVYKFLKEKKVALTKDQMCRQLDLKMNSIKYALGKLRKEGKVGYMRSGGGFSKFKVKVYWGLK